MDGGWKPVIRKRWGRKLGGPPMESVKKAEFAKVKQGDKVQYDKENGFPQKVQWRMEANTAMVKGVEQFQLQSREAMRDQ
ncbi:hypothetical protein ACSBR1_009876 [Camellia fascicularis]